MTRRPALVAVGALTMLAALMPAAASARGRDGNRDRIPDRWEIAHHLSLKVKQTKRDQDRDGLDNLREWRSHTDPRKADTDGDGLKDGAEASHGDDPTDDDSDNDGIEDGQENAGTVDSFDSTTHVLTILLADGTTKLSATVTGDTELECRTAAAATAQASDDGEHSGSGDGDQGADDQGDDEQGDDDASCTTAELTRGTIVHEAELSVLPDATKVWDEVELVLSGS